MTCQNPSCPQPTCWAVNRHSPSGERDVRLVCGGCGEPRLVDESRLTVMEWIDAERRLYADVKYPDRIGGHDPKMAEGGMDWWVVFLGNYLRRAELLRVETPQGRQALGKLVVTAMDCLESAIRVHGPMPAPGVSSGEIIMPKEDTDDQDPPPPIRLPR